MAIFKLEVEEVAPNKNKLGTILAPLLRSREDLKPNLNPQSETLTTIDENGTKISSNPIVESPINIHDNAYQNSDSESYNIFPNQNGGQVSVETDLLSEMINDPRYSIYNGENSHRSSLADQIGISRLQSGSKPSKSTVEISKIQSNQNKNLTWNNGKVSGGNMGDSYLTKITKEFYARKESDNGLMSKISGAIGIDLGGKKIFLKNFTGQDPATNNYFSSNGLSELLALTYEGHKSLEGLSLGSNHLWDISMDNYYGVGEITYAPKVPCVTGKKILGSLGNFIPASSYSYSGYSTMTQSLDLVNEGQAEIIKGTKAENELEIEFVEDENFTWKRYFTNYINCIVDREHNAVAPYQQSVLKVSIMSYNPAAKIFFMHRLLVLPIDFSYKVDGEESASEITLSVRFSVVGDQDKLYRDLRN